MTTTRSKQIVYTETSAYLIDDERRTVTRYPGAGDGGVQGLPAPSVALLRGDREEITLVAVLACEIGARMLLMLDLGLDSRGVTFRETTIVRSIDELW